MITKDQAWELYVQGLRDHASTLLNLDEIDSSIRTAAAAGKKSVELNVYYDMRSIKPGESRPPDSFLSKLGDLCEYLRTFGYSVVYNHGGHTGFDMRGFYKVRVSGWDTRKSEHQDKSQLGI